MAAGILIWPLKRNDTADYIQLTMRIQILDTKTGSISEQNGITCFNITDNNWSCDCNRINSFDYETGLEDEEYCIGSNRFLIIKLIQDRDDDYPITLSEANSDYPTELIDKHIKR